MASKDNNKPSDSSVLENANPRPEPITDKSKQSEDGSETGAEVVARYLRTLPGKPGVYRMIDASGQVLYVGKAKNLKKRSRLQPRNWVGSL